MNKERTSSNWALYILALVILVSAIAALLGGLASQNADIICNTWCANPTSDDAYIKCIQGCQEALQ